MRAALARDRADLRLADVVEKLEAERRLKRLAERRRQRLGGREADAVREPEPHLARGVGEVREEARRARVHAGGVVVRNLDLQAAGARSAVDDQTAVLLEGSVQTEPARHDVVGERHVRDLARTDAHGCDRLHEDRRPAALLGQTRDVDRPGGGLERGDLRARHGQELAEGRAGSLVGGQVGLLGARHAGTEVVVGVQVGRPHAGGLEGAAVVGRALGHPRERVAQAGEVGGARWPVHPLDGANRRGTGRSNSGPRPVPLCRDEPFA